MNHKSIHQKQIFPIPFWIIVFLGGAILIMFSFPPIPQDPHYHNFADQRFLWGIAHCNNVLSNLPFLIASIIGLVRIKDLPPSPKKNQWKFFFLSIGLVAFGSAYYHHLPNATTLFWDRLPMSFGFAALSALFFADRFPKLHSRKLFYRLLFLNLFSVFYWLYTEILQRGDLRLYILVQYLPMLLIPLTLLRYPKSRSEDLPYWLLLIGYAIGKICEIMDFPIYSLLQILSGHSLKHLLAAASLIYFSMTIPLSASPKDTK